MHGIQEGFAAIVFIICLLTITKRFGTGGKVDIRDAEYAIWLTQGCFTSCENIIRIHKTANASIVCKRPQNDYTWITTMTHTNLEPGLVKVVT